MEWLKTPLVDVMSADAAAAMAELGVMTLSDLADAVRDKKLRGFDERVRERDGSAWDWAERIVAHLNKIGRLDTFMVMAGEVNWPRKRDRE